MIPVPSGVRVWLATGVTDMRRAMNTLALQVQQGLGRDPHGGDLIHFPRTQRRPREVFVARRYRGVAVHPASGAGSICVAIDGGRGGVDQRSPTRLPARGD